MARIYVPAASPDDWQRFLKDPVKHWRTGYSARTLAHSWHSAVEWPPEIQQLLVTGPAASLRSAQPLLIIPEKITPLLLAVGNRRIVTFLYWPKLPIANS